MPTIFSHAAVPLALGLGLGAQRIPTRLLVAGVVASILPDLDVLAFRFHIAYADALGHRGASHSLVFALCLALVVAAVAKHVNASRATAFWFVAVCTASHGVLDMFTNGGLGAALWWPFSEARVFAPWQVIEVSPLSLRRVFSARGWAVLQSELLWVWMPASAVCAGLWCVRRQMRSIRHA
jgi:inner membrane protein